MVTKIVVYFLFNLLLYVLFNLLLYVLFLNLLASVGLVMLSFIICFLRDFNNDLDSHECLFLDTYHIVFEE